MLILAGDFVESFPSTAWTGAPSYPVTVPPLTVISVCYPVRSHVTLSRRKFLIIAFAEYPRVPVYPSPHYALPGAIKFISE